MGVPWTAEEGALPVARGARQEPQSLRRSPMEGEKLGKAVPSEGTA